MKVWLTNLVQHCNTPHSLWKLLFSHEPYLVVGPQALSYYLSTGGTRLQHEHSRYRWWLQWL